MSYVFWKNGAPSPAPVRGGGNRRRLRMPDGTIRMGRIVPDPAADLYAFADNGPAPGPHQIAGAVSYSNDGWTVRAERAVAWKPVADIRALRIAEMNKAANALLSDTDWYVVRAAEEPGKPVPAALAAYRSAVRQAANDFAAAIGLEADPAAAAQLQPMWPAR